MFLFRKYVEIVRQYYFILTNPTRFIRTVFKLGIFKSGENERKSNINIKLETHSFRIVLLGRGGEKKNHWPTIIL